MSISNPVLRVLALALFGLLCPGLSCAASFECAQAKSPFERTVCADTALSALNDDLARTCREAMEHVKGKWRTRTRYAKEPEDKE
ncbi:MAG: hypothetical protein LBS89_01960 [Zoogloeaceae bacterium]|nr:hypothetical protein [Zoogloeaceae bacterium]